MIAGLRGVVRQALADEVLLDVAGVVYRVFTTRSTLSDIAPEKGEVFLHTHLVVREDAMLLFGFSQQSELTWFETLITVQGIGPKLALAIISKLGSDSLLTAISHEDVTLLSSVPGVGKRTASRIVLDLAGKLPEQTDVAKPDITLLDADMDAIAALRSLGYTAAEAQTAVGGLGLPESATVEDRIVAALRAVGSTG